MAQASDCPCKRYRVFDLGPIGDPETLRLPGFGYDRTVSVRIGDNSFGINDKGQVVATAQKLVSGDPTGAPHMMLWLPVADYGIAAPANPTTSVPPLPVSHWRDLHEDVWGTSDDGVSVANDINDLGQVVGGYGVDLVFEIEAHLVELGVPSSGSFDATSLHQPPTGVTLRDWSVAYGINEDAVTATSAIAGAVRLPCENETEYLRGFRTDVNAGALALLSPHQSEDSVAYDPRSRDSSGQDLRLVGFDGGLSMLTPCSSGYTDTGCEQLTFEGLVWSPGPTAEALLPIDDDAEVVVTGINREDQRCGASRVPLSETDCPPHATHWDPGTTTQPYDLNLAEPQTLGNDRTLALAISDVIAYPSGGEEDDEYVLVVGWNISTAEAVAWSRHENSSTADDWCQRRLQDIVLPCSTDLVLIAGPRREQPRPHRRTRRHDRKRTSSRAFILTDVADLDGDMRVNGADLGILLAAWLCSGGCPDEDCDGDGDVDGADLGIVLSNWSGQDVCTVPPICAMNCPPATACGDDPEGCGGSSSAFAGGAGDSESASAGPLGEALEALGFSSTETFVEWAIAADPDQLETVAGTIAYLMKEMP